MLFAVTSQVLTLLTRASDAVAGRTIAGNVPPLSLSQRKCVVRAFFFFLIMPEIKINPSRFFSFRYPA